MTLLLIDVVGNIGAGKSTVLQEIDALLTGARDHCVMCEPIEVWRSPIAPGDKSSLEYLYEDTRRNGFAFQMFAQQTRFEQMLAAASSGVRTLFVERSCIGKHDVFAQDMRDTGALDALQYHTYTHMKRLSRRALQEFVAARQGVARTPRVCELTVCGELTVCELTVCELTVYLRTRPELCLKRVMQRGRKEECDHVTHEYLLRLHALHDACYRTAIGQPDTHNSVCTIEMDYCPTEVDGEDGVGIVTMSPGDIASAILDNVRHLCMANDVMTGCPRA